MPVHALYYPPASAEFERPKDQAPPVIVTVHGGPTGSADRGLKLKTQFWTSRGFAVCDVDYSGSWGYGRPYRERLDGAGAYATLPMFWPLHGIWSMPDSAILSGCSSQVAARAV